MGLEQGVLGLGIERGGRFVRDEEQRSIAHETSGERELLPLAETDIDAAGPCRSELRVETRVESCDDILRACAFDRRHHGRFVVHSRKVADADTVSRVELESKEILKSASVRRLHFLDGYPRDPSSIHKVATVCWLIEVPTRLPQSELTPAVLPADDPARARF